jgi:glycosyltransferase involved in cell wall biosynthesis
LKNPFISIIIPYYHSLNTIIRTIQSVLNQSDGDFEVLVIDDGSDDGLDNLMLLFNDERLRFYRKANSGPCDTRNFGVEKSKGQFLAFLDSDDWLAPDWLDRFKVIYEKETYEVAYCFGILIDEETQEKVEWNNFQYINLNGKTFKFNNLVGTFVISRSLFDKSGKFDPNLRYGENMDLAIRILSHIPSPKQAFILESLIYFGNSTNLRIRNSKYGRTLMLRDLRYFQIKNQNFLKHNPKFLKSLIRRQLLSATICLDFKSYMVLLKELFVLSIKDGIVYSLLLLAFPINYFRLKRLGFRS